MLLYYDWIMSENQEEWTEQKKNYGNENSGEHAHREHPLLPPKWSIKGDFFSENAKYNRKKPPALCVMSEKYFSRDKVPTQMLLIFCCEYVCMYISFYEFSRDRVALKALKGGWKALCRHIWAVVGIRSVFFAFEVLCLFPYAGFWINFFILNLYMTCKEIFVRWKWPKYNFGWKARFIC